MLIYIYIYTYIHTYTHTHIYIYILTYIHTYILVIQYVPKPSPNYSGPYIHTAPERSQDLTRLAV